MSPEEIIEAYSIVVDDINNRTAQEAARIGNAQASLGTMAERVARPSGTTSGLANYTYNRTMRPVIDSTAAALTTAGYSGAMDKNLGDALRAAKNRYEDAKNAYTVASTTPSTTNTQEPYKEETDTEFTGEQLPYTAKGTVLGTGSSGNGVYDVIVADGEGGSVRYQYIANSADEALDKHYFNYNADGSKKGVVEQLEDLDSPALDILKQPTGITSGMMPIITGGMGR